MNGIDAIGVETDFLPYDLVCWRYLFYSDIIKKSKAFINGRNVAYYFTCFVPDDGRSCG